VKKAIGHRGSHIVIIGAGGVGLSALMIVKATTDYEVIVVDIRQEARDAAEQAGASHILDANDKNAHRLIKKISDGGACAVVDCVGSETSANLGMRSLAKSGILIIVGLFGGALQVSLPLLPLKDITIRGSDLGSLSEMGELMELARAGRIDPIPIETRALDQAQQTLYDLAEGNLVGRVVLEP
jgi:D-arabinose 1-dehydrogenase-like Zn-dependent alcohol dehydrogenase